MISEKTVELNLSRQMCEWFQFLTGLPHFVVGPTQREEGVLGYDVEFVGGVRAVLVQFKRAYVAGNRWTWLLNRTRSTDQHSRLQSLEQTGLIVFYAFPHFATTADLQQYGRWLPHHT